ncbi:MAG: DNA repair putative endonuclease MmcB [Hyphomonadaceae bacterium]|nr:DNA repair putative endonuclease MmcB [Hyphomonadaceae bacterium]
MVDVGDEPHSRPEITAALARGVTRLLHDHGLASLLEAPLANGRRADIMGLSGAGEIWIVETKSCVEDFAVDQKWPDYTEYCDRFFFAVTDAFPQDLIPEGVGLIVADGFGGAIVREAPLRALAGARRKAVTLLFARLAAQRLAFSQP